MPLTIALSIGIVFLSVSLHYEALRLLTKMQNIEQRWYSHRIRASLLVIGCLLAHAAEVTLFGIGFQFLDYMHQGEDLLGTTLDGFNYNYYSFVVYTTIGFGDVVPVTPSMRLLTAVEGLTGSILVAWTASFMFFHMQRFWRIELPLNSPESK